jgi:hypothetical protein
MMSNEAIKNALLKYLESENHLEKNTIFSLKKEVDIIKSKRVEVDDTILNTKINIIKSNVHLLIDKIHREDKEGVLKILKNTKDIGVFYDFLESMNDLLKKYGDYENNYSYESPELLDLKETFVLNDHQLTDLITEINLDNK